MADPRTEVIIREGGREIARHVVAPSDYVIGRDPGCSIAIPSRALSGRHAQLSVGVEEVHIEDLGSGSGTFVDGVPVTGRTRVAPDQQIQLGPISISVRRFLAAAHEATVTMSERTITTPQDPGPTIQEVAETPDRVSVKFADAGKYEVGHEVARGGMGAVLQVKDRMIRRGVAMKVMLRAGADESVARFVEEAQITGQLEHPGIVPVHDLGLDEDGRPFYTMKFVHGLTLRGVLEGLRRQDGRFLADYPLGKLLTIYQKVCDALAFAHARGVIHRDLKPDNIMIGDYGEVLVMDWGLAKICGSARPATGPVASVAAGATHPGISSARQDQGDSARTLVGDVMGTPTFMSPEQASGAVGGLDARSDIFALGAILYNILTLELPFHGATVKEVLEKVRRVQAPLAAAATAGRKRLGHLPGGRVPASLSAVAHKAMARRSEERYQTVPELQRDIEAYQNGFATSAEHAGLAKQLALLVKRHKAAAMGAAAVLLVGAVLGTQAIIEGRRAARALADLRATAPTFFNQAQLLTEQEHFSEALEKIDIALQLKPQDAAFHAQRGNILQALERFAPAAEAYTAALRLDPQQPHAADNVALSQTLAAALARDGTLAVKIRTDWCDALVQQGRGPEAIFAGRSLFADAEKMRPAWQAKIDAWLGKNAPRIIIDANTRRYYLDLSHRGLTNLAPLRGMPLHYLIVNDNPHLKDLSALADCTLDSLAAQEVPDLMDLAPLKGKNLTALRLYKDSALCDLGPLAGMPLKELIISLTAVRDLTPLRGMKLKSLSIDGTAVRDLEPLRGQLLEVLNLANTKVATLEPVGDAPLVFLDLINCGHLDLAGLRQRQLRGLHANGTVLDHLEVLAEMTELDTLILPMNLTDPALLRKLPRLRKIDFDFHGQPNEQFLDAGDFFRQYDAPVVQATRRALLQAGVAQLPLRNACIDPAGRLCVGVQSQSIASVAALHGLPVRELNIRDTAVSDLEPLRGMPLECLRMQRTKVTSLEPLRGLPLVFIILGGSPASDVGPLADCPNLAEIELPRDARNVEALRSLKKLRYISTVFVSRTNHPAQTAEEFWRQRDAQAKLRHDAFAAVAAAGMTQLAADAITVDDENKLLLTLANQKTLTDLTPLCHLPLRELNICGTAVRSLEPLRGLPLEVLQCSGTPVSNLDPLRGLPLRSITMAATRIQDVGILAECPTLESIQLPTQATNVAALRPLKKLRYISMRWNSIEKHPAQSAEEFWRDYDARPAGGK